jgi:serine/threonine-protein kinase
MRHFAMKVLLPEAARKPEERAILFHEAEVGKKLAHANLVRIISINRSPDTPFFVMEFFPSGSLRTRIQNKDTAFLREHIDKIVKHAATGLAYMNASGWIHRDVKPDNIIVNSLGDTKLIDFAIAYQPPKGLAKLFRRRGKAQGTRSYMSPEQIRGHVLDARADVYSFGSTFYEVVAGRPPFRWKDEQDLLSKQIAEKPVPPKTHNPDVTDDFNALLLTMLAKKREDRPKDFHEILMKLRSMRVFKTVFVPKG